MNNFFKATTGLCTPKCYFPQLSLYFDTIHKSKQLAQSARLQVTFMTLGCFSRNMFWELGIITYISITTVTQHEFWFQGTDPVMTGSQ